VLRDWKGHKRLGLRDCKGHRRLGLWGLKGHRRLGLRSWKGLRRGQGLGVGRGLVLEDWKWALNEHKVRGLEVVGARSLEGPYYIVTWYCRHSVLASNNEVICSLSPYYTIDYQLYIHSFSGCVMCAQQNVRVRV